MDLLESSVQRIKRALRLTSASPLVQAMRPAYDVLLNAFYGSRGLKRLLHHEEPIRLRPVHRYAHESYEPSVYTALKEIVSPGAVVLDIGAHVGLFTVILARWAGATGRVFAFEPTPATRHALTDHLALNDVAAQVEVLGQAVSDTIGEAPFHIVAFSPENTLNPTHSRLGQAQAVRVPVTTIDAFCGSRQLVPSVIKIDIEGFELHALRGAKELLTQYGPAVIVELHPMLWSEIGESYASATALLDELAYQVIPLEGQRDPLAEYGHVSLRPLR